MVKSASPVRPDMLTSKGPTMAAIRKNIPNRLRFEVLRRDNNTCRYCGATAPTATLVLDHVIPVALGGASTAENLVAACVSCNSGKTSTSPGEHLVAEVNDKAIRWSQAIRQAAEERSRMSDDNQRLLDYIGHEWSWRGGFEYTKPDDWATSILSFYSRGLSVADFDRAIDIAHGKQNIALRSRWAYFCGVLHNFAKELEDRASQLVNAPIPKGSRKCGHCVSCVRNEDCYGLTFDTCEWCGIAGCDYQIGFEEGSIATYQRLKAEEPDGP